MRWRSCGDSQFSCLLDHFGHEEQASLDGRGALLVGLALVGLAGHVVPQAQGHVLDGCDRVRQGRDARGIHSPHLFHDVKETIELSEHALTFCWGQLKPRLIDGALYFNHPALLEKQLAPETLTSFIREWALSTGVFHSVYGREQLLEGRAPGVIGQRVMKGFNGERSGDVVLTLKPFLISGSGKPGTGTTHGSPFSYDTHIPVLFYGGFGLAVAIAALPLSEASQADRLKTRQASSTNRVTVTRMKIRMLRRAAGT